MESCPRSRSSVATRCQSHALPPPPWMSANVDTAKLPCANRVLEVRDAGRLDRPNLLQLEVGAEPVEEPRAAADDDVPPGRGRPGLVKGRLDPVGHEGEG